MAALAAQDGRQQSHRSCVTFTGELTSSANISDPP